MIYGYGRCSTYEGKQDVARQIAELRRMGADIVYTEYESGRLHSRPELDKLLLHIQSGDTLVALEVTRVTRSTRHLCDLISLAQERRLKLQFGTYVIDCTAGIDPITQAMLQMMGVFAELERGLIVDRIRSGLALARSKGVRLGRPRLRADKLAPEWQTAFEGYRDGLLSVADIARLYRVSRPTVYRYFKILTDA